MIPLIFKQPFSQWNVLIYGLIKYEKKIKSFLSIVSEVTLCESLKFYSLSLIFACLLNVDEEFEQSVYNPNISKT